MSCGHGRGRGHGHGAAGQVSGADENARDGLQISADGTEPRKKRTRRGAASGQATKASKKTTEKSDKAEASGQQARSNASKRDHLIAPKGPETPEESKSERGGKGTFAGRRPPHGAQKKVIFELKVMQYKQSHKVLLDKYPNRVGMVTRDGNQSKYWKFMTSAMATAKKNHKAHKEACTKASEK